jgi:hypothetical protein
LQFLSNLLKFAGSLAAQWGEEILLHLQVATLWIRIGKKEKAVNYLSQLASLHAVDAFNLGDQDAELEVEANQGSGFSAVDWFWLLTLGVIGPALLLYWGWTS